MEWASWLFQLSGILVERGAACGMGILPVSFPGGQNAHSTPIQREDSAMPKKCRSRFT
ncbi:MAG: hypothetical protein F6J98_07305 [Moorea sp. SIO4G2]|uniref:hypothetical protein n=1 Tax=Moorena sp. SIO3F7 TaxID=2607839 RepID=UPI0013CA15C3|nr:hypothetical protein [Moorena sp. SIO3F7]NEO22518.1 hypothetical protein [Moorena sp. SIO4A5]NEO60243.1 hypothetical protein [Moorena sp. SIO4G2]